MVGQNGPSWLEQTEHKPGYIGQAVLHFLLAGRQVPSPLMHNTGFEARAFPITTKPRIPPMSTGFGSWSRGPILGGLGHYSSERKAFPLDIEAGRIGLFKLTYSLNTGWGHFSSYASPFWFPKGFR